MDRIVTDILSAMSLKEKSLIANMDEKSLPYLQYAFDVYLSRNIGDDPETGQENYAADLADIAEDAPYPDGQRRRLIVAADRLVFLAGSRALETIRSQGLAPDHVKVVAGAAGGPKWLILAHFDRMLFGSWFRQRRKPLYLLGSSIGSWRFAADSCEDPVAAIDRMENAYIHQTYDHEPTPREISEKSRAIIDATLQAKGPGEVLTHPVNRLSLVAVRSRHLLACEHRLLLGLGLGAAALANTLARRSLRWFFRQTLFSDPRTRPPFLINGRWPDAGSALSPQNLGQALLASGSIPYVMEGVRDISGATPGVYRDGGAVDYHLDIPLVYPAEALSVSPFFRIQGFKIVHRHKDRRWGLL
jgi:hypothetical protein